MAVHIKQHAGKVIVLWPSFTGHLLKWLDSISPNLLGSRAHQELRTGLRLELCSNIEHDVASVAVKTTMCFVFLIGQNIVWMININIYL